MNHFFLVGGPQQPYDQGQLGSCTANALAFCFAYSAYKQDNVNYTHTFMPSRLDIYYHERLHMGKEYVKSDSGANISDAEWILQDIGVLPESDWTYYDSAVARSFYTPPPTDTGTRTTASSVQMYAIDQTETAIKTALAHGYPVLFGMTIYDSFESDAVQQSGVVPMPNTTSEKNMGGHAVAIVGYTDNGYFIVRNSWGVNWGLGFQTVNGNETTYNTHPTYGGQMRGYFEVPVSYLTDASLADSFYAVQAVNNTLATEKTSKNAASLAPVYDTRCTHETPLVPEATVSPPTSKYVSPHSSH